MVKYVLLLEKINATYKVVAKIRLIFKSGGYLAVYHQQTFVIDTKSPAYTQFVKKFLWTEYQEIYVLDINQPAQLIWNGAIQPIAASDLDQILSTHVLKELTAGVQSGKEKMVNAIIGFFMGALTVGLILVMYYTNLIQTLQDELIQKLLENNITIPNEFFL